MTADERQAFLARANVGILAVDAGRDDRAPVQMPVWYTYQPGEDILITTQAASRKVALVRQAGRFSLCVQRDEPPYVYVTVEGPATISPGADPALRRHIAARYLDDRLTAKYVASTQDVSMVILRLVPQRWLAADFSSQLD
jgi:PPOX class probable F420-dependent enzyme